MASLVPAIIAVVFGTALGVALLIAYAREVRARHLLRVSTPELSGFDADVQRYLERIWLLIGAWKPRVGAEGAVELDNSWEQALNVAKALQQTRASGNESADLVADLVRLETEIEEQIDRLVSG